MSQQRPDRIKQMLHYLWQHRHLSTQQAMELFGYAEATVRRDFQYIVNQYPGMIRGHGCLDFDDSTDDKEYVFDVKRTLQSVAKREIAALARTMIKDGDCFSRLRLNLPRTGEMPGRCAGKGHLQRH